MKQQIVWLAGLLCALIPAAAPCQAVLSGGVVVIDGSLFDVNATYDASTRILNFGGEFVNEAGGSVKLTGHAETGGLGGAADPLITYILTAEDFDAPSDFFFLFVSPIAPIGTPNTVSASLSGVLGDAAGDGVSVSLTGVSTNL